MTTSKIGVGEGSNRVGVVVGDGIEVKAGLVVAMSVGEGPTVEKPFGTHAAQRTRM